MLNLLNLAKDDMEEISPTRRENETGIFGRVAVDFGCDSPDKDGKTFITERQNTERSPVLSKRLDF